MESRHQENSGRGEARNPKPPRILIEARRELLRRTASEELGGGAS